jgi:hypothetical protein
MNNPGAAARTPTNTPDSASLSDITSEVSAAPRSASALILAAEWRLPYRTLRCAARCFDRVYVLGSKGARPLARALSCRAFYDLPTDRFDSSSVSYINALCDELLVDVVMPSDAPTTRFLTGHAAQLGPKSYPLPDTAVFDLLNDKSTFIGLCRRLGIPTPMTEVFSERRQLLDRLRDGAFKLPVVAKPTNMEGSRGVMVLNSGQAYERAARLEYAPIMVQEFIGGRDLCAFYFCRHGTVEVEVLYHHGGHFLEFIEHPDIGRHCRRIIQATNYTGVIGFDIRQHETGDLCFLECNPRFWYNMELVMLAGFNFVELGLEGAKLRQAFGLAGKVMIRPAGLLRRSCGGRADLRSRLAVLGYLADDLPMMVSIGLSKIHRTIFDERIGDRDR